MGRLTKSLPLVLPLQSCTGSADLGCLHAVSDSQLFAYTLVKCPQSCWCLPEVYCCSPTSGILVLVEFLPDKVPYQYTGYQGSCYEKSLWALQYPC